MINTGSMTLLVFLGAISGLFFLFLVYHLWYKRSQLLAELRSRSEHEEYANEDGRMRQTGSRKKSRVPKLWDVGIPKHDTWKVERDLDVARCSYDDDDDEDEDMMKDVGRWNTIKPVSVAYIKTPEYLHGLPPSPLPNQPHSSPIPRASTSSSPMSHKLGSSLTVQQGASDAESRRSGTYDKAAIEAVQVSVLISMPRRPQCSIRADTAGPLEFGVAKIALDGERKWKRRPSAQAISF